MSTNNEVGGVLSALLEAHWEIDGTSDAFACTCSYPLGDGSGDLYGRHRRHMAEVIVAPPENDHGLSQMQGLTAIRRAATPTAPSTRGVSA